MCEKKKNVRKHGVRRAGLPVGSDSGGESKTMTQCRMRIRNLEKERLQ